MSFTSLRDKAVSGHAAKLARIQRAEGGAVERHAKRMAAETVHDSDDDEDKQLIKKGIGQHDSQLHPGKHTKLHLRRGGAAIAGALAKPRLDRPHRARGGAAKGKGKGKGTHVNVIVAPQGGHPGVAPPAAGGMGPPPGAAPRPPIAPAAPPPPMGMPPPGAGPSMGGMPPRPPLMNPGMPMRNKGGRVRKHGGGEIGEEESEHFPAKGVEHERYGAKSGMGRLEKQKYAKKDSIKGEKGSGLKHHRHGGKA